MGKNRIKQNGIVYTPKNLANFMANQAIKYASLNDKETITILEPSVGDGVLLSSLITAIRKANYNGLIKIYAFEIDANVLASTKKKFECIDNVECNFINEDFVSSTLSKRDIYADIIISNPPYVRLQTIENKEYIKIARDRLNLGGKIDLYQIFFALLANVLAEQGIISIVVSNKFLTNKTGFALRKKIQENYKIRAIYDFGDTKLFNAAVLPAVLLLEKSANIKNDQKIYVRVYSSNSLDISKNAKCDGLFEAINNKSTICKFNGELFKITNGELKCNCNFEWYLNNEDANNFINIVKDRTKYYFKDFAKIRVGIKTTADKVFISDKWERFGNRQPELLRPLITHRVAGQYLPIGETTFKVLYPYLMDDGKKVLANLNSFPKTKEYLYSNYDTLNGRTYIKESNKEWFEIWVPHSPDKWDKTKIVFRDITVKPTFWLAKPGEVVNGDCYWFDFYGTTTLKAIYVILAISNSTFIERYYDTLYNNKLYSGRRRFMSQYVENFPVFDIDSEEAEEIYKIISSSVKKGIITEGEKKKLDILVSRGFNQKSL